MHGDIMCITLVSYIVTVTVLIYAAILEYICVALLIITTTCVIKIMIMYHVFKR